MFSVHAQKLKSHELKAIKGGQVTKIIFAMTAVSETSFFMQQQIITIPTDREGKYKVS